MEKRYRIDRVLRQQVKAMPCFICYSKYQVDPCHVKTFGSSGIDAWWNLVPMCRNHHNEQHALGWRKFCDKYPKMAALLQELGWELNEAHGKFWLFNEKEKNYAAGD